MYKERKKKNPPRNKKKIGGDENLSRTFKLSKCERGKENLRLDFGISGFIFLFIISYKIDNNREKKKAEKEDALVKRMIHCKSSH